MSKDGIEQCNLVQRLCQKMALNNAIRRLEEETVFNLIDICEF
jgi:hypothetical protein